MNLPRSNLSSGLAIHGGEPVRRNPLPYGRQSIDETDIAAVLATLRSDWLTTGPEVAAFESEFATATGVRHAVAVSNGTAGLHAAVAALEIGPGDEIIVPAVTFAATANAVVFEGGTPVFADVDPFTLLVDIGDVERRITSRTRAVIAVDYAGQPCDYDALTALTERRGIALLADACHSLGGSYAGHPVGGLALASVFSFHPVKPITTGEGGMITTDDPDLAGRMRRFRNHGIATDHRQRAEAGTFAYEMVELGYNYRLTDLQCALGRSQLRRLPEMVARRRAIAAAYRRAFEEMEGLTALEEMPGREHAWHLYVIRLDLDRLGGGRDDIYSALRAEGILANVHYVPVHLHPYYRRRFGTESGMLPHAEKAYRDVLTLPLFASMSDADVDDVVRSVRKVLEWFLAKPDPIRNGSEQRG